MLWVAAALAVGIDAGWWVLAAAPAILLVRHRAARLNLLLLILAASLGAARSAADRLVPADSIAHWIDRQPRPAALQGLLLGEPEFVEQGRTSRGWLKVEAIRLGERWTPCSGKLQVRLPAEAGLLLSGQRLELYGTLRPPRSAIRFDETRWLWARSAAGVLSVSDSEGVLRQGADGTPWFRYRRWVDRFRRHLQGIGRSLLEPRMAGFLEALLLGEGRGISRSDWEIFRRTGTVHVLVVSGLHVGLIGGICLMGLIALRLPRTVCYGWLAVLLATYGVLTGMNPPIVRSTIGGLFFCWAKIRGIAHSTLNLIGTAALGMLAVDPRMLSDPGFQLSFAAVLAVVAADLWLAERLQCLPAGFLLRAATTSTAAWLATLPILASCFHGVSLLAPLANLFIVPWASGLVVCGFLVYAAGWFWSPCAGPFAASFGWASQALVDLAGRLASWPGGYWSW